MEGFREGVENWLDVIEDRELGGAIVVAIVDKNHLIGNTIGAPPEGMSILMTLLVKQLTEFSDPMQPLETTIMLLEKLKQALEAGKDINEINFGEETDNAESR